MVITHYRVKTGFSLDIFNNVIAVGAFVTINQCSHYYLYVFYWYIFYAEILGMLRAQEIQQIETHRRNIKKETYKHILETFDKKIRSCVNLGISHVLLEVPSFVFGYPFFDHDAATVYLKRQLENLGYKVNRTGFVLVVSWSRGLAAPKKPEVEPEDDLPSLMNLRKIASKIIQQDRNGGSRRGS